jgi:ABC-type bacteriocin/lantibiotic exporter with double-glycine peptidase domain/CRP-like cAMP-binding protein
VTAPARTQDHDEQLVRRLPFVAALPADLADLLARLFQPRSYDFGEEIIREGDEPDGMYVLASGTARVVVTRGASEVTLARLEPGQWFGESALLADTKRNATVRSSEPSRALYLDRVVFNALLASHPEVRGALSEQGRVQKLNRLLRMHAAFDDLSMEAASVILPAVETVEVPAGETVIVQGQPGIGMFIVEEGRLEAVREEDGVTSTIGYFSVGDLFGERSLLSAEPCVATIRSLTDCRVYFIDAGRFEQLSATLPAFARRVREVAEGRDYRTTARLPLDFAQEVLPGGAAAGGNGSDAAGDGAAAAATTGSDAETQPFEEEVTQPPGRASRFAIQLRPKRRFPVVQQIDEMDCGVACLSMMAMFHGVKVSTAALRDKAGTGVSGTTLRSIAEAGRSVGLEVDAMKLSRDRAGKVPLPAIIHWKQNHWVVLTELNGDRAVIADPAIGRRRVTREELAECWDGFAAVVTRSGDAPLVDRGAPNLRWLVPMVRSHRKALVAALALALVAAACEVAFPLVVERIVNDVISPHAESLLDVLGLVMVALLVGGTAAALFQRLALVGATSRFDVETLDFVTERLLKLPMSYFAVRRSGDIERRLSGVREIRRIVVELGIEALSATTQVLAGIAIMFVLSPVLAAIFLVAGPVYAVAMRYSSRRLRPLYGGIEESFGRYMSDQVDLLKGIETVKSTGTEEGLRHRLREVFADFTARTSASHRTIAGYGAVLQLVALLTYGLFVFLGAIEVHNHQLTLGAFVAFTTLVMLTTSPLLLLLNIWDDVQVSSVLLNRIADVLEHEPEQAGRADLLPVPTLEGHVRVADLSYQPPGADHPIVSELNLEVEPGTTVGVVGRSGSGKSTLLRLLAGLIEPTAGSIFFDRVESTRLDYGELRRKVGVVLQTPYVFAASIAENIALGDEAPDAEAVRQAAQLADLAELVDRLPLGYETLVGDRGLPLSGGQAQRLAIARALYRNPPLLLFDEATSALDTESEAIVKRNLDRVSQGRTAFVVAHRLSTVRSADVIIVLEAGRLVEQGTHDELMARQGIYFYLYSQQALD